jgi:glutathione S-transferase
MIRFYYHPTPNPLKISLFLEETGLPYEVVPVDTSKGEQHLPEFRNINPNSKVPAIVDTDGPGGKEARVFDSNAILLYLADKTGKFGGSPDDRPELLSNRMNLCLHPGTCPGRSMCRLQTWLAGRPTWRAATSRSWWSARLTGGQPVRQQSCWLPVSRMSLFSAGARMVGISAGWHWKSYRNARDAHAASLSHLCRA